MHAHILTEFCSLLTARGHTFCQSYPSCSLSPTPLICLPLRLSLSCCPSLSQTFDTPVAAITIANVWSVGSNLSYRFKWDRGKEAERKLFGNWLVWTGIGHVTFNLKFNNLRLFFLFFCNWIIPWTWNTDLIRNRRCHGCLQASIPNENVLSTDGGTKKATAWRNDISNVRCL